MRLRVRQAVWANFDVWRIDRVAFGQKISHTLFHIAEVYSDTLRLRRQLCFDEVKHISIGAFCAHANAGLGNLTVSNAGLPVLGLETVKFRV